MESVYIKKDQLIRCSQDTGIILAAWKGIQVKIQFSLLAKIKTHKATSTHSESAPVAQGLTHTLESLV